MKKMSKEQKQAYLAEADRVEAKELHHLAQYFRDLAARSQRDD